MIAGRLIAESLRVGAVFEPDRLRVRRISREDVSAGTTDAQPPLWTLIDFEADDADADALAAALADSLAAEGGWYADFQVGDEHVVVYANRFFRYVRSDAAAHAEAVAYGRSVGVPDNQLDWKE